RITKQNGVLVVNKDDNESKKFLALPVPHKVTYSLKEIRHDVRPEHIGFSFKNRYIESPLKGEFNLYNMLAAATYADYLGISGEIIKEALEKINVIKGRAEEIHAGQDFTVVVDYAHTADSLRQIYEAYTGYVRVGVLGGTGGGRDTSKRK